MADGPQTTTSTASTASAAVDESFGAAEEADTVPAAAVERVVRSERDRGRAAGSPTQIPARGMRDVLARVRVEVKGDHIPLLSAGIAFYALLALAPALVAVISIYGLVASADQVRSQILNALSAAPREVRALVSTQLESIAASSGATTIIALVIGIMAALWSASAGVGHLIDALNVAYDEEETRGFVRGKAVALAFTAGAVLFVAVAFVVITVLPALIASTGLGAVGRITIGIVRWIVLLAGMQLGLAVLYRYGPDRDPAKWRWVSPGALIAAVMWILGSLLFSLYTANFAKYNETYGSLGAVVVLMLWLFLTALAVLVGAEINAEMERQTALDTTEGRPRPLGERRAHAADTVGAAVGDAHIVGNRDAALVDDALPSSIGADEIPLRIAGLVGLAARCVGVRSDRARVVISRTTITVRYGRWVLVTPLANIVSVDVTGPYKTWKVAGPPHLSFSDAGLTFATNRDRGVCITFADSVPGLLPFGLLPHPSLTFTAADPDRVAEILRTRIDGALATIP
ncbi:MAG: ribonuclease [Ilumatobacteraceae bacterium]|nr:ribonuclease [Ilumatobacteraceae bacterium]